jgi:pimeloyl-ACP methyl ester carboxylesterase
MSLTGPSIRHLVHGRVTLAMHCLRAEARGSDCRPLLLLHGLGERTPAHVPAHLDAWPGPVWGLDFTGHGQSTVPLGGGYTAEVLLGDADAALSHLGQATVVGRGLGAYIALLLAGARTRDIGGTILCDGPGLAGGGVQPPSPTIVDLGERSSGAPDPQVLLELARDLRPPDYVLNFVRFALDGSLVADPIALAAVVRPEWLAAVAAEPGVITMSIADALVSYSS